MQRFAISTRTSQAGSWLHAADRGADHHAGPPDVGERLPDAQITFDKFHVVAHTNAAVDKTRGLEQRIDPELGTQLKGVRITGRSQISKPTWPSGCGEAE